MNTFRLHIFKILLSPWKASLFILLTSKIENSIFRINGEFYGTYSYVCCIRRYTFISTRFQTVISETVFGNIKCVFPFSLRVTEPVTVYVPVGNVSELVMCCVRACIVYNRLLADGEKTKRETFVTCSAFVFPAAAE